MEWYMWVLVGVYVWVYVSIMVNLKWYRPIGGALWAVVFMMFSPFVVIMSVLNWLNLYDKKKEVSGLRYDWFEIGELNEEQKTTLRTLKVDEGDFSHNGIPYEGFRVQFRDIHITYGGRIVYRVDMEHKTSLFIYKWLKRYEVKKYESS